MCKKDKIKLLKELKKQVGIILPKGILIKLNGLKLTLYEAKEKTFNIRISKNFEKYDIDVEKELNIIKSKINYLL